MSWQVTAWVIEHSKHKGSALLTLLCIANCANEDGTDCWPNKERLARDTRLSKRQLDDIVNKLEASGELCVKRSQGRVSNHYSFPLMKPSTNPAKIAGLSPSNPAKIAGFNPAVLGSNPAVATAPDPSVRSINKNRAERAVPEADLDPPFHGEAFLSALEQYEAVKKEIKSPITPTSRYALYAKLAKFDEDTATLALMESAVGGWKSVFPEKVHRGNGHSEPPKPAVKRLTIREKMGLGSHD